MRVLASYDNNFEQITFHVAQEGKGLIANDCARINNLFETSNLKMEKDLLDRLVEDNVVSMHQIVSTSLVKMS